MVKINRASLGRLPFPVASLESQLAFLNTLKRFDSAVDSADRENKQLMLLRGALLTEIFGGN